MLEFYQRTVLRTKEEKTAMCGFRFRLQRLANNKDMVAREGLEPPPPAFSGLLSTGHVGKTTRPLREEMILNDERFHRSGAFFVIVNSTIDTTAHGITPHEPSIVRAQ